MRAYRKRNPVNLQKEHQIGFDLEHPLDRSAFNKQQHLMLVGNAGDVELIGSLIANGQETSNLSYMKKLSVRFFPFRELTP